MKKAAVGAAAAGVVWSAPRVEGLSLRPNYAAAGSGVAGGGVTSGFATLLFRTDAGTDTVFARSRPQLGSNASGNPAFASVNGSWPRNASPAVVRINGIDWSGVGTAFVDAINQGPNLASPTPPIAGTTSLAALSLPYTAAIVSTADVHRVTVRLNCA